MTDLVAGNGLSVRQAVLRVSRRQSQGVSAAVSTARHGHANWAIWLLFWAVVAMGCTMAVAVASMDV
ncbi:MAG: hypothetical protein PW791_05680 [Neorhizobium sp.]|jgi:hypothetical protein|nr:hypothetical protein [Neorhizobium sp.]